MQMIEGQKKTTLEPQQIIQSELDETYRGLKEVNLMLEQSRVEVNKLAQRNAAITAHLQQIQGRMAQMPVDEIRLAYDSALDAQQRLFVMRGQLEKLQSDQAHLERYKESLERFRDMVISSGNESGNKERNPLATVEMLVNVQEAERQRLSRQMHDGPAQALSNFILQTEIAMRLFDIDPNQARTELGNLKAEAMRTFQKVRNFIFDLRPMMLDDLGLVPTIRRYVETFKEQGTGMDVNLTVTGNERRIEPYREVLVFRAMQEFLGNSTRYSQASLVKIQIDMGDNNVKLSVDDNGKGFDTEFPGKAGGLGLKLIKERLELLGGSFTVDSAPSKGARVTITVPARTSL
jgi:two-component system, NarL family, sensor histidine kinase DegS